jgi:hypothetical protein
MGCHYGLPGRCNRTIPVLFGIWTPAWDGIHMLGLMRLYVLYDMLCSESALTLITVREPAITPHPTPQGNLRDISFYVAYTIPN